MHTGRLERLTVVCLATSDYPPGGVHTRKAQPDAALHCPLRRRLRLAGSERHGVRQMASLCANAPIGLGHRMHTR